jgi:hypothetical protein
MLDDGIHKLYGKYTYKYSYTTFDQMQWLNRCYANVEI